MTQQRDEEDRNCSKVAARVDELESLISGNKDLVSYPAERGLPAPAMIQYFVPVTMDTAGTQASSFAVCSVLSGVYKPPLSNVPKNAKFLPLGEGAVAKGYQSFSC